MSSAALDMLIVAGLLLGLARGLATGAVRQITGLAGTVLSIVLAVEFMGPAGGAIGGALGLGQQVALIAGFVLVFAVGQLVLRMLTKMIETGLKAFRLGLLNRAFGAALGVCKAALLMSVLFLVLGFFRAPTREYRESSMFYGPVAAIFPVSWDFVAHRFPAVQELSDRFDRQVRGTIGEIGEEIIPVTDDPEPVEESLDASNPASDLESEVELVEE